MPAPTSPATESPPTTATDTGRNSGSTMASAAAGYREPLDRTADRNVGPSPGCGAILVMPRNAATRAGSPHSRPIAIHVRGLRSSLTSSTLVMVDPIRTRPGHLEQALLARPPSAMVLAVPRARLDQPGVDRRRVLAAH